MKIETKKWAVFVGLCFLTHCTSPRVRKYESALDPRVGQAKKAEINKLFGSPSSCQTEGLLERCEYRTAYGKNEPVPDMYRKQVGVPDLSPYDQFDVLNVYYNSLGVLQSWDPVVVQPH